MNYLIQNREPISVFHYFEEICAIPHGSYHEEKLADYLVRFAADRGLFCTRDKMNNVFIKLPASSDRAGEAPILFQGHIDMVCEKDGDVEHDFLTDPLSLYLEKDLLRARGTTLGGDDGIAVAMMLALLDGAIPSHPAFECLFTTAEEVGLDGAKAFDYSQIAATRMLNLDSEDLGIVTAGCAGGVRTDLSLSYSTVPCKGSGLNVRICGLAGGHSGADITRGRANANRLMGRLLTGLAKKQEIHLISIEGGSKDNAIPRECGAKIAVTNLKKAIAFLQKAGKEIFRELSAEDSGFRLLIDPIQSPKETLSRSDTDRALAVLTCSQIGVMEMSKQIPGLVESSRNLGVVRSTSKKLTFIFSGRSSVEAQLDAMQNELDLFAQMTGCTARHHSRYPGWDYAPESAIRTAYCKAYEKVTGRKAVVNVIHAGLECGIIRSHLPELDMISIGPDLRDIHSPNEALVLPSVTTFWKVLEELIQNL
ncbi:MAG: aminoacyl-histidine dipeptidase [Ruminococcaceae bacterium]|nr:aminoacyl-histidine dipeptidase [Oscillospiraceae bacterium]